MTDNSIQSKGGVARAESLTAEQRSKIAQDAANAKWSLPKAIFGTPDKKLKIGERELECYVLEDGTRVLSGRGMQEALGLSDTHGGHLKNFLSQNAIKPFFDNELTAALDAPLRFIRPGRGGRPAVAYEATILPRICDAVLEARKRIGDKLTTRQLTIADQCEIIARTLAKVGIIALVDEVTGYQQVRDREALQKILERYLTDEWANWSKTFPDDFYRELFRLKGIPFPTGDNNRPSYVGHWTNDVVYDRLAPGVKKALREKNPRLETGNRSKKHHQFLTRDYGHPKLKEHLSNTIFLMKTCANYKEFEERLNLAAPKYGDTIPINFNRSN